MAAGAADGTRNFVVGYDRQLESLTAYRPAARKVLVTLQFGFSDANTLKPLLDAIREAGPEWQWWIRLHPAMSRRDRISALRHFEECTRETCEIQRASKLPLYALLRHMDAHITHSASTVLEAESFGVPSIVFSDYGAELFQEQIASGQVVLAFDGNAVVQALRAARRREPRAVRAKPPWATGSPRFLS